MNDDANYEKLKAAVQEFNAAEVDQLNHISTWGHWYQRNEIVTWQDRISEEKIHRAEKAIGERMKKALDELIFAAREYTK